LKRLKKFILNMDYFNYSLAGGNSSVWWVSVEWDFGSSFVLWWSTGWKFNPCSLFLYETVFWISLFASLIVRSNKITNSVVLMWLFWKWFTFDLYKTILWVSFFASLIVWSNKITDSVVLVWLLWKWIHLCDADWWDTSDNCG